MSDEALAAETCLVTGSAGFIGSHLVERLLGLGARVVGVDNLVLGQRANLAGSLANINFSFRELDVNDGGACLEFVKAEMARSPIRTLWHLAANSDIRAGVENPDLDLKLTFMTTYNLLRMMETLGIPKLVFASTSAIYGQHDRPLREDSGPLLPISTYGAMKLASEAIISAAVER